MEKDILEEIEVIYDKFGRIEFNPVLHFSQGKPWTTDDLEYICKFSEVDEMETMGMAIGRTGKAIAQKLTQIKKEGRFEYYRNLNKYYV